MSMRVVRTAMTAGAALAAAAIVSAQEPRSQDAEARDLIRDGVRTVSLQVRDPSGDKSIQVLTESLKVVSLQQARAGGPKAELQGFSMVLVLGDMQAGPAAEGLSPAARKALADMKDFLPYKSYRLLDTVWILSGGISSGGATNTSTRS